MIKLKLLLIIKTFPIFQKSQSRFFYFLPTNHHRHLNYRIRLGAGITQLSFQILWSPSVRLKRRGKKSTNVTNMSPQSSLFTPRVYIYPAVLLAHGEQGKSTRNGRIKRIPKQPAVYGWGNFIVCVCNLIITRALQLVYIPRLLKRISVGRNDKIKIVFHA